MNKTIKRRYVHSPFTVEHMGIKASVSEDGKVTLVKEHGDEYDEIVVPASIIFKLGIMLKTTRKVHFIEESDIKST